MDRWVDEWIIDERWIDEWVGLYIGGRMGKWIEDRLMMVDEW